MSDQEQKAESEGIVGQSASTAGLGSGVGFATAFFAELSAAQQPLSPDFAKVLYDNLWQLYEK